MDKAAVIIVHYGGEKDTRECLNSILINRENPLFQIIVVINPSQKSSFAGYLKKNYPQILVIENERNTGFSEGNNIGIKRALRSDCEYIILLNNDTIVPIELFDKLVSFAKKDPNLGLMSPKIYFAKGFEYHKDRYSDEERGKVLWYAGGIFDWKNIYVNHRGVDEIDEGQYDQISETDFATGCCMLMTKKAIERVGLFDENYFLYYEDIDYSIRVRKNKMKVIYYPQAFLWHKNASSSGKPGSKLHIYYQNRNRLYFGFKYADVRTKKSLVIDSLRLFKKGGAERQSVLDYYLGRMGQGDI